MTIDSSKLIAYALYGSDRGVNVAASKLIAYALHASEDDIITSKMLAYVLYENGIIPAAADLVQDLRIPVLVQNLRYNNTVTEKLEIGFMNERLL